MTKFEQEQSKENPQFESAFQELQGIVAVLKELGLDVPEYCFQKSFIQEQLERKNTFPIARDGMDGIRARQSRTGGFRVFFTNGFDDPNDSRRVEIATKLREKGFDVVK